MSLCQTVSSSWTAESSRGQSAHVLQPRPQRGRTACDAPIPDQVVNVEFYRKRLYTWGMFFKWRPICFPAFFPVVQWSLSSHCGMVTYEITLFCLSFLQIQKCDEWVWSLWRQSWATERNVMSNLANDELT